MGSTAELDEIKFAMEWLKIGIEYGASKGKCEAMQKIRQKWRDFAASIGQ